MEKAITILGITGHVGRAAAQAFVAAGWQVTGMGREDRAPVKGVSFVRGDAKNVADIARAVGDDKVVLNALNLPYHQWDKGRMEAQAERVIAALKGKDCTMLFPGNIYNYAATQQEIFPDTPQIPQTPRGEIRVRTERLFRNAAQQSDLQIIILRAGDFYMPDNHNDWYDQVIMREAGKGRIATLGASHIGHAWAYLPDLGRAFVKLAELRDSFGVFENFHFEGHYATHGALSTAIQKAVPMPTKIVGAPWGLLNIMGLFSPMMREVLKMRYLWNNSMALRDPRLEAILGPNFATPFEDAVAQTIQSFLKANETFVMGKKLAA